MTAKEKVFGRHFRYKAPPTFPFSKYFYISEKNFLFFRYFQKYRQKTFSCAVIYVNPVPSSGPEREKTGILFFARSFAEYVWKYRSQLGGFPNIYRNRENFPALRGTFTEICPKAPLLFGHFWKFR